MQTFLIKRARLLRLEEFVELEAQDAATAYEKARSNPHVEGTTEVIHETLEIVGGFPAEAVPMDSERA
jgi:hypothetical protein